VRTIKLKGAAVASKLKTPKTIKLGQVATDAVSTAQSITLVNYGAAPISFMTAPAATPPFNVTANTCNTLAANGGTCTISVEFAPHKHGKYVGTLELQDDAVNSPQHIKLVGISR